MNGWQTDKLRATTGEGLQQATNTLLFQLLGETTSSTSSPTITTTTTPKGHEIQEKKEK